MKNNTKLFIGIIIGVVLTASIGVAASVLYNSSEVGFTPSDSNWNVNTVQDAINDLYENKNVGKPDKILNGIDSVTIDDNYKFCVLGVGRSNATNSLSYNNQSVTYDSINSNPSGGNASVMMNVFFDLKENDTISFYSAGTIYCWK